MLYTHAAEISEKIQDARQLLKVVCVLLEGI